MSYSMSKKVKPVVTRDAKELAEVMGLTPADAVEWVLRHRLTNQIIEVVKKRRLTVTQIANGAKTSRARVYAPGWHLESQHRIQ